MLYKFSKIQLKIEHRIKNMFSVSAKLIGKTHWDLYHHGVVMVSHIETILTIPIHSLHVLYMPDHLFQSS